MEWNLFSQVTQDGLYNWAHWSCPSSNLFIVTCEWRKPGTPQRLRTKSLAHLLCQERFLNLEDLIQPENSKLTYIKDHPCSTLDALLCEVVSYGSCEGKNPQRWTEAFPGRLCQSRKDCMRRQGNPETTGDLLWICVWRQMFILVVFVVQWNKPSLNYKTSKFPSSTMLPFPPSSVSSLLSLGS